MVGSIWDNACDNRSAYVVFKYYTSSFQYDSVDQEQEGRGCGNGHTFDHSAAGGLMGVPLYVVNVSVYARNVFTQSAGDSGDYYP